MSAGDNIGMMEGAFFVSKGVILDWVNELLDVSASYIKIRNSLVNVKVCIKYFMTIFLLIFSCNLLRLNNVLLELCTAK